MLAFAGSLWGLTPVAIIGFNFVKYQCENGTAAQQKKLRLALGLKSPEDSELAVKIDIPREIKVAL